MHILILGAGALGSLFGARLSQTEARVSLMTTNKRHIQSIRQNGLIVEELSGKRQCYTVSAYDEPHFLEGIPDLVVVVVKTYEIARLVGEGAVLVGTTAQGSTLVEPGRIRHGGNGPTFIGEPQGPSSPRVESTVALFQQAGLKTEARDHMEQLIWEKLHANVGINAITALAGIKNGFVADNEFARDLCSAAVREAMLVASAKGFEIDADMPERVLSIARSTAVNRSSMGQDVDRRKRTEIDVINGAIVAFGEQVHIPTPINQTLTRLVKILEAAYLVRNPELT